jgi:hypothetical protein
VTEAVAPPAVGTRREINGGEAGKDGGERTSAAPRQPGDHDTPETTNKKTAGDRKLTPKEPRPLSMQDSASWHSPRADKPWSATVQF